MNRNEAKYARAILYIYVPFNSNFVGDIAEKAIKWKLAARGLEMCDKIQSRKVPVIIQHESNTNLSSEILESNDPEKYTVYVLAHSSKFKECIMNMQGAGRFNAGVEMHYTELAKLLRNDNLPINAKYLKIYACYSGYTMYAQQKEFAGRTKDNELKNDGYTQSFTSNLQRQLYTMGYTNLIVTGYTMPLMNGEYSRKSHKLVACEEQLKTIDDQIGLNTLSLMYEIYKNDIDTEKYRRPCFHKIEHKEDPELRKRIEKAWANIWNQMKSISKS